MGSKRINQWFGMKHLTLVMLVFRRNRSQAHSYMVIMKKAVVLLDSGNKEANMVMNCHTCIVLLDNNTTRLAVDPQDTT